VGSIPIARSRNFRAILTISVFRLSHPPPVSGNDKLAGLERVLPAKQPSYPYLHSHVQGDSPESIVDIQETDTYTRPNRRSTDLLAGVVQHPEN
jgi:hypothetical protein